jgi:[ribosomal protein S18]-alanine N-acetyltransferase
MTLPAELRIRPMVISDVEAVMAIERATDSAPHWVEVDYLKLFDRDSEVNFKRLSMVIEVADELAGFAIVRMLVTGNVAEAELESIVVTSKWRRQGVGRSLLSRLAREAEKRGAREIILEVRASNTAAIQLYRRADFREAGRRIGYYRDPEEDAVLMTVTL